MVFNSLTFAAFFVVVYGLYVLSAWRLRLQNALLLAASCFFYGYWDWRFLGLIWLSTSIDYLCARLLDRRIGEDPDTGLDPSNAPYLYSAKARRTILVASIVSNLGILGFFKYFDFFATGGASLLRMLGLPLEPRLLNLILPVGISFYTFQSLSYTIDVYRGDLRAVRSLMRFGVFVAFFPQLVAGPILRAREFLPQVCRPRRLNGGEIWTGGYLVLWGLFKKVVIADNLALLVDHVYRLDAPGADGAAIVVATYAFAVQIYCDFSGYTDIARGCARMMGFHFGLNFDLPYLSSNPVEFWRRWHISLSSWLRDYLYIPLGGNRRGTRRTCINLMLTMILGGLWHGAAWTFVLWGAYQGCLLVGYRMLRPVIERLFARLGPPAHRSVSWLAVLGFFQLVCLGWMIFRCQSVDQLGRFLDAVWSPWPWWILQGANSISQTGVVSLLVLTLPLLAMEAIQRFRGDLEFLPRCPVWVRGVAYAAMFYGLVLVGATDGKPFIYFQF
ncbi:MAG: MBOAT family protein [Phycisphaerae bacterium]|nr:MBOAT family protein [Phycisphaerae bacterium]